jgi:lipoprotein-anchoring transpeptidase ErfK/SrfK
MARVATTALLVLLVRKARVVRAIHVSTGASGTPTPSGRFRVYRRERESWSKPFRVWLPWASYFSGGVALHGYPDVPAYPASHGCVRIPLSEAHTVYAFARLGISVDVDSG